MARQQVDGMALLAFAFLSFMIVNVVRDRLGQDALFAQQATTARRMLLDVTLEQPEAQPEGLEQPQLSEAAAQDPNLIAPPYPDYTLTQGMHGFDYGHAAIDLTGGKGATIFAPIYGVVTAVYMDDLGNTVLVIENERYLVTMLHGIYHVQMGENVSLGQPVGQESNQGNTVDALGQSCRGRDCGYHTHLNIYDKLLGMNVNPLDLFGR